ncbi:hypothetical protein BD310DRAFT_930709 [Dichomitus squalens]|uniref:Uncharacterized protein n=1 Tax=Dichomitus squalens TaxID=114155 RepID=A0A4Q9PQZ4_9APHY|nr:hypothetical protein BD310DRAFT_930709 [Dichomitus squalens]
MTHRVFHPSIEVRHRLPSHDPQLRLLPPLSFSPLTALPRTPIPFPHLSRRPRAPLIAVQALPLPFCGLLLDLRRIQHARRAIRFGPLFLSSWSVWRVCEACR